MTTRSRPGWCREFAGIVYLPLGVGQDCIIWYRREVLHTVNWLGDQTAANRANAPVAPQLVHEVEADGRGADCRLGPGGGPEAVELRNDITDVLLRRIQAQLAHQSLHDDLTGLANRRQATPGWSASFQ